MHLSRTFAVTSVLFLAVLAISPAKNALRPYRSLQRQYARLGAARTRSAQAAAEYAARPVDVGHLDVEGERHLAGQGARIDRFRPDPLVGLGAEADRRLLGQIRILRLGGHPVAVQPERLAERVQLGKRHVAGLAGGLIFARKTGTAPAGHRPPERIRIPTVTSRNLEKPRAVLDMVDLFLDWYRRWSHDAAAADGGPSGERTNFPGEFAPGGRPAGLRPTASGTRRRRLRTWNAPRACRGCSARGCAP